MCHSVQREEAKCARTAPAAAPILRSTRMRRSGDDSSTIREVVRVLCETVVRSRTLYARRPMQPLDLGSAWFNVQVDRIADVEAALGACVPFS